MQEPAGTIFGQEATEQIAKTVREVSRMVKNETPIRGRWQYQGGNVAIKHGIVTVDHGCGWYTIEKAEWNGTHDTYEECDPCIAVTGEGTSSCAITLSLPISRLTGLGTFVEARDCGSLVVPLIVGTDCLIANLGDVDTATGTPIWQVINGQLNLIVEYKENWDCCEGSTNPVETLISKTPVILIGKECAPITCGECPY